MDWTTGEPVLGAEVVVEPPGVLVPEGRSAGPRSGGTASVLCWMPGPDEATRLEQAVLRDGAAHRARLRKWQTFERGWFAVDRPFAVTGDAPAPIRVP